MRLKIVLTVLILLAAACGGDDDVEAVADAAAPTTSSAPATTAAPTTDPPATTAVPTTTPEAAGGETLVVASSGLGDILVDSAGNTLYLFVPDAQGSSTCYDGCAEAWPPLVSEVSAGDGVDAGLLGLVTRDGGGEQVTYNGWPLYYFANDAAAGDTNGQGVNDVWYVLDATGNAITG